MAYQGIRYKIKYYLVPKLKSQTQSPMATKFSKFFMAFSLLISLATSAQQNNMDGDSAKNEIKLNASNLIAFSFLDGSYEYLINEESSFGIGILASFSDNEINDEYRTFSLTPYYRQYFSKGYAKGFFVEGFGMLNTGEDDFFDFNEVTQTGTERTETYTDFALGISLGGKFVTKRGFVAEVYGGIGRNLLGNSSFTEIVGRGGISLGYRF